MVFVKPIIIRKPKFMRSEFACAANMLCAKTFMAMSTQSDLTTDERYDLIKKSGECINKAAKAGGFFRTKDFIKWCNANNT
jgi:hypothetical protein